MIKVKPAKTLKEGVQNIIEASNEDYKKGISNDSMYNDFVNGWKIKEGRKFIKLIKKNYGVHSFISKENFKHFKIGDVLKPASWAAPALNQARGNVFEGNFPMQWTGPLYLR